MTREQERAMEVVARFRAGRRQHFYLQELIIDALAATKRETIEECARIAENDEHGLYDWQRTRIAAAIREKQT